MPARGDKEVQVRVHSGIAHARVGTDTLVSRYGSLVSWTTTDPNH